MTIDYITPLFYNFGQIDPAREALCDRLANWCREAPWQTGQSATACSRILAAFDHGNDSLDLSSLGLASIPDCLKDLPALNRINLAGNPLTFVPAAIASKLDNINTFFEHLRNIGATAELTLWADHLLGGQQPWQQRQAIAANSALGDLLKPLDATHPDRQQNCHKNAEYRYGLALAGALKLREDTPRHARDLLDSSTDAVIELDGLPTLRSDIEALANGRLLPDEIQAANGQQQLDAMWQQLRQGWQANVHLPGFLLTGAGMLAEITKRNQVTPPSLASTKADILSHLTDDHPAIAGLEFALAHNNPVREGGLDTDIGTVICQVWAYCKRQVDDTLRNQLISAFSARLRDIGSDRPCAMGCVQRLLQAPEGIDLSLARDTPDEATLQHEILGMVSEIDSHLDQLIDDDSQARKAVQDTSPLNAEEAIQLKLRVVESSIRRSFIDHRGLPAQLVSRAQIKPLDDLELNELLMNDLAFGKLSTGYRGPGGRSALQRAVEKNDLDALGDLLATLAKEKGNPNVVGANGETLLMSAAGNGQAKVVEVLLGVQDIEVNLASRLGFTALMFAVKNGRTEVVKTLVAAKGIALNAAAQNGGTPLHAAAILGHIDVLKILLAADGIAVNTASPTGATPLHVAAATGRTEVVSVLIAGGGDVNAVAHDGRTPLYLAVRFGQAAAAQALIRGGGDVNAAMQNGSTPLHDAARFGQAAVAKVLIAGGGQVNAAEQDGTTPLHVAARFGRAEVAQALLAARGGVNMNAAMQNGASPLHVAAQFGQTAVAQALLAGGGDANAVMQNGASPLHVAAQFGQTAVTQALLAVGGNANAVTQDGRTPLHIAAQFGHVAVTQALLARVGNANAVTQNGWTPLHIAAQFGHAAATQALLAAGGDANAVTQEGLTPAQVAAHFGQAAMAQALLTAAQAPNRPVGANAPSAKRRRGG